MPSTASEVEWCNIALGWLGANRITSLDGTSEESLLCRDNSERVRRQLLEDREWTFAVRRYTLAPDAVTPEYGWGQRFTIPAEVLRVLTVDRVSINNPTLVDYETDNVFQVNWIKEGRYVFADEDVVYLRGIVDVPAPADWTESFGYAFAARLASHLAIPLTRSQSVRQEMLAMYESELGKAAATDGLQGRSRRIRSKWLQGRR